MSHFICTCDIVSEHTLIELMSDKEQAERLRFLEEENVKLHETIKRYQMNHLWMPADPPPDYTDKASNAATDGSVRQLSASTEESLKTMYQTPDYSDVQNQHYLVGTTNRELEASSADHSTTSTRVLVDKIEQLARENERMAQKMSWQMNVISVVQAEKEDLARRCSALENQLNLLQQSQDSMGNYGGVPWAQILEPLHWLSDEQHTCALMHLPYIGKPT